MPLKFPCSPDSFAFSTSKSRVITMPQSLSIPGKLNAENFASIFIFLSHENSRNQKNKKIKILWKLMKRKIWERVREARKTFSIRQLTSSKKIQSIKKIVTHNFPTTRNYIWVELGKYVFYYLNWWGDEVQKWPIAEM